MISSRIKSVIFASVISAGNLVPTIAHASVLPQSGAWLILMNHAGTFDRQGITATLDYIDSLYEQDPVNVAIALTGGMQHEGRYYLRHYMDKSPENRIEIYNLLVTRRDNARDPAKKNFWNRFLTQENFFPNGPPTNPQTITPSLQPRQ